MVAYAELTDVAAVERALEEFDRLGRHAFLQKYGYGEAREYFLVTESGRYDSKAIFAAAYEYQHGIAVSNDEIHGGRGAAASRLAELGFDIEGLDDSRHRVGKGVGETIELPVNRLRDGGGSRKSKVEARVSFCPNCSMQLPASGECAYC